MHAFPIDPFGEKILRSGSIISADESPMEMLDRIVESIRATDMCFDDVMTTDDFLGIFRRYLLSGALVPNTAIMTNLGRHHDKPLSACTVPDIDLLGDMCLIKKTVDDIHLSGMGTGFNLDSLQDPIKMLDFLNQV